MERQYTWGGVPRRSLDVTIAAGDTSIVLSDGSSWPDNGPFWITLERDSVNEERVLIASRALNTLTVATGGRGRDRTTARSHTAGSSVHVEHTLSGEMVDAMNAALAAQTTKGDLLVHNGAVQVRRDVGADGLPLVARSTDATGIAYEPVGTVGIADLAVTGPKLADNAVTANKIADGAIGSADIANDAIGSQHYADGSVQTAHLADGAVTGPKIAAGAVGSSQLAPDAVGPAQLATPQRVDVYADPAVSITTSWASITSAWNGEADPYNMHSAGVFTAPVGGVYAFILWGQGSLGGTYIRFRLAYNGLTARHHSPLIQATEMSWEPVMQMSAGNTVTLQCISGGAPSGFYLDAAFVLIQAY